MAVGKATSASIAGVIGGYAPLNASLLIPGTYLAGGLTRALMFVIDGGGLAITTGLKGVLYVPFNCTITAGILLADQSGSIVVDVFKNTYTVYDPPTHPVSGDKITASAPLTISSAKKSKDTTLSGWTTALLTDDTLSFNVNSATTVTRVTVALLVNVT